jgi:hypothetical protein
MPIVIIVVLVFIIGSWTKTRLARPKAAGENQQRAVVPGFMVWIWLLLVLAAVLLFVTASRKPNHAPEPPAGTVH